MLKTVTNVVNVSQITGVLPVVNGGTGVTTSTGTGSVVLSAAPTLSGNVTLSTGNLIVASGQGIDFSATPGAPGVTSELLADYEEGFWTPSYDPFAGSFTTLTYTTQLGTYVRIGRTVICQFNILVNVAVTGTAATLLLIQGFPFALTGDGYATARAGGFINFYTGWTTNAPTMVNWAGFTDRLGLLYSGATNISNTPPANVTTGCELHGCVIYQI
jgi:hypothetical protein